MPVLGRQSKVAKLCFYTESVISREGIIDVILWMEVHKDVELMV